MSFLYFAYGSNMLPARLAARCPSARLIGLAQAPGHLLRFWKHGMDGSGKATLIAGEGAVPGVLWRIDRADLAALDAAEGAGRGYDRDDAFAVLTDAGEVRAATYIAPKPDPAMRPFDWYLALVRAGARHHGLDAGHQLWLAGIQAVPDPETDRPGRQAALAALAAHGWG